MMHDAISPFRLIAYLDDFTGPSFMGQFGIDKKLFIVIPDDKYKVHLLEDSEADAIQIASKYGYRPCQGPEAVFSSLNKFYEWVGGQSRVFWPQFRSVN